MFFHTVTGAGEKKVHGVVWVKAHKYCIKPNLSVTMLTVYETRIHNLTVCLTVVQQVSSQQWTGKWQYVTVLYQTYSGGAAILYLTFHCEERQKLQWKSDNQG